jgi:lipopolysaccharide export system protein LptA
MTTLAPARIRWFGALVVLGTGSRALICQNAPPARGGQPAKECSVDIRSVQVNGVVTSHAEAFGTPTRERNIFYGGGFDARCAGTTQRIRSDSAEQFGDEKRLNLIGNVHYTETRLKLDSDRMTYFTGEERLIAEGNVRGITSTGTHFTGPRAEYLRVAKGIRDRSRLTAESRPNVWLSPTDAGSDSKDSTNLQADRVISENDSLVYAKGKVVIERPDLATTSDSAFMDNGKEIVRLAYTPRIVGRGDRKFTLEGDFIDIYSKKRKVQRVKSSGHAKATSEDVLLTADSIDLRITGEKLSRAYAWGPGRARAKSTEQDLTADSIDVVMPGQVLREMHALRNATAEGAADTAKIISKDPDRLKGDTIVAYFDSVAAGDTSHKPAIRQIIARGSSMSPASSYYQVAPAGTGKTDKPNVNYVMGREIIVDFKDHQVDSVTVSGQASGFYLEAPTDSSGAKVAADSTTKRSPAPKKPAATKKPPGRGP